MNCRPPSLCLEPAPFLSSSATVNNTALNVLGRSPPPYSELPPLEQILRTGGAGQRCESTSAFPCHWQHPSKPLHPAPHSPAQPARPLLPSVLTPSSHLQPPNPPHLSPASLHSLCVTKNLGAGNGRRTGRQTDGQLCVRRFPVASKPGPFFSPGSPQGWAGPLVLPSQDCAADSEEPPHSEGGAPS